MKIINLVYLIILLLTINCYSQTEHLTKYYDSLSKALAEKPGVHSIKVRSEKYKSGIPKEFYCTVKYTNDSTQKAWAVGQVVTYYSNGQLEAKMNLNNESKPIETSLPKYRKDGSVELTISFKPDSVKYYVIEGNDVSYYYPDHVVFSWYNKTGKKKSSIEQQYDYDSKKYVNDGLSYYYSYSSRSTFILEEKYKMGKRLSKRTYLLSRN